MSNWYGTSRSNYFRVKDETSFRKWTDCLGIGIFKHDDDPPDEFQIILWTPSRLYGVGASWLRPYLKLEVIPSR